MSDNDRLKKMEKHVIKIQKHQRKLKDPSLAFVLMEDLEGFAYMNMEGNNE